MEATGSTPRSWDRALERCFEVTSVVPLAGFMLVHLATYGRALFGATEIGEKQPISGWDIGAEALLVWLPLTFHAVYSFRVWRRRRHSEPVAPNDRAFVALHRQSGTLLALFLLDHWVRFRLPILRGDRYPSESVLALARELSTTVAGVPLPAAAHALGTLALSFHLAYGLMRIGERHTAPESKRRVRAACAAVGVVTALSGTLTVVRLAAG